MRRIVSLSLALLILVAGLYLLYFEFFKAQILRGVFLIAAGSAIAIGITWLWDEITDPSKPTNSE